MSRITPTHLAFALTGILAGALVAPAAAATLCTPPETAIFSCRFQNAKIASVCRAPALKQDYIAYRFGKPGRIELTYQADAAHPGQVFHRVSVLGASNADDRIWFKNREHLYLIYMPVRGLPGLEVSRNGETVARLECKADWVEPEGTAQPSSKFMLDHGSGRESDFENLTGPR